MNRLIRCSEISTSNQVTAPRLTDQPIESLPIAQRPCTAVPVWALTCAPVPGENAPRPEEAPCVSRGGYASTPLRRSLALSHADAHTGRQGGLLRPRVLERDFTDSLIALKQRSGKTRMTKSQARTKLQAVLASLAAIYHFVRVIGQSLQSCSWTFLGSNLLHLSNSHGRAQGEPLPLRVVTPFAPTKRENRLGARGPTPLPAGR